MASTTGVGDEEAAPLLATSPTSSTGVINSQYQSLSQISSSNDSDISNTSNTDPGWTLSQSARRLYISHTLSTWNSRVFEFGSVLYLASIFPGTLMPLAIYSIVRGASAITLSSWVGSYIDRKDRLNTVRLSIVVSQRLVVAASCVIFFILSRVESPSDELRVGLLAALIFMACVEKLAAIMNLVSVERDWVIVVARSDTTALRSILDGVSTETAILVNLAMNCTSVIVEYFTIAKVYYQVPELQHPKTTPPIVPQNEEQQTRQNAWVSFKRAIQKTSSDLRLYFTHPAFAPSFSIALLYCTVLSFGGVMVTYLLASGYTSAQIAAMRTVSVTLEVLATWIGPWVMKKIGPVRAGLWFLSWELGCLAIGVSIFWRYADNVLVSTLGLVCGSMLSRIGLWGVDLSAQVIIQEEVEAEKRGAFSAVEASWQNVFEMCSYTSTIIFSSPSQFHNPTALSVTSVFFAWLLYSSFVKKRRGHLVHWPTCMSPEKQQATIDELFESGPSRRREGL
ncbi:Solute carrier family 40 member 1 [Fusarium odoratissimum]|uniref:Solute carrier family 40 member n=1 Tax=Fusarium oxysporum f. sp. cubense (strain race 4) TaxID=2502994 RepID=N1R647_FUSC4|nr:Solute carrier family 40 member 1 [Fusarium odoratissimum]